MPPLYHRVWQFLKYRANHAPNQIPMHDGTEFKILPGQHLTSIRNIAKGVGWWEGLKWKEPNPKTVSAILDWMVKQEMIIIDKGKGNRQYTLVTIANWESYQEKDGEGNIKVTVDGAGKKQQTDINKNDKECSKNDEENIYSSFFETYNNQNIITHKELTSKMKQAIDKALKNNSDESILESIKRYGEAFRDIDYQFCKYKMTLDKFLTQNNGYYDWLDEGQKWINYSDFKNKGPSKPRSPEQQSQSPKHKTKFHLAKSRGDKYTAYELEELILSNQKKKINQTK